MKKIFTAAFVLTILSLTTLSAQDKPFFIAAQGGAAFSINENGATYFDNNKALDLLKFQGATSVGYYYSPRYGFRLYGEYSQNASACNSQETMVGGFWPYTFNSGIVFADWIINGGKVLVTQADEVDVFMVIALTRDQIDFTTMQGVDIFFVPTSDPGFSVGHIEHKVGLNGSRTGSVYFDNCRVSEADRIPNPWGILMGFGPELSGYAALALGGAETMIAKTADYLKNRIQMGRSLWDTHQAARHDLAQLQMEVYNFRNALYGHLANRNCGIHDSLEAGALKAATGPLMEKVASECMLLMGGTGVIHETGIERYYRDAKALQIACFSDKTFVDTVAGSL